MTAYEIIMIILGILALLVSFGGLIIALLTFLDKRNRKKKIKMPILSANRIGGVHKDVKPCPRGIHIWSGCFSLSLL